MTLPRQILRSAAFYPITGLYGATVLALVALSRDRIDAGTAIVVMAVLAVTAVLTSMLRELRTLHDIVSAQRTELLDRIDQLVALMHTAGVTVPDAPPGEARARQQAGDVPVGRGG